MIKKIKEYFESRKQYNEAKHAMTLMLLNQYSDLLESERSTKEAELEAYKSMKTFGDSFNPEDLQNMITSVNKIATSPDLTSEYYKKVHDDVQTEKNLKVVK